MNLKFWDRSDKRAWAIAMLMKATGCASPDLKTVIAALEKSNELIALRRPELGIEGVPESIFAESTAGLSPSQLALFGGLAAIGWL